MAEECERCSPCRQNGANAECHYKDGFDIQEIRKWRNLYRNKEKKWKVIENSKDIDDYTIDDIRVLEDARNIRKYFNDTYILEECLDCDYGHKNHTEALEYLDNILRNVKRNYSTFGDYVTKKDKSTKMRKKKLEMTKESAKTKKLSNKNETYMDSLNDILKSNYSVKKKKGFIRQMQNEKEREKKMEKLLRKAATDYKRTLKSKTFKILKRYSNLTKKRKLKLNTIVDNATKKLEEKLLTQTFDIFKRHSAGKKIYKSIVDNYETIKYKMQQDDKEVTIEIIDEDLSNIRINLDLLIKKIKELGQIINIFENAKFKESKIIFENLKDYLDIFKNKLSLLIDFRKKYLKFQDLLKKTNGNIKNDSLFMDYEYFKMEELHSNIKDYNIYIEELEENRKKNLKLKSKIYKELKSNTVKLKKSFKPSSKKKTKRNSGNDKRKKKFEKIQKDLQEEYEHLSEYLDLLNEVNKIIN